MGEITHPSNNQTITKETDDTLKECSWENEGAMVKGLIK